MADADDELGEALTAEEILTFGPVVEAQVWHPMWVLQERAPIAVAAGRPKFGPVFNEDGVGKAVVIRPCVSRGRRVRGLPPIYSPSMLEAHAGVFAGWPMFMDHVPGDLAKVVAKRGRSVKDLGGQVLSSHWNGTFVHEDDASYGYRPGGVLAEIYANPVVQKIVGRNPNVLHTSIHAWPTSGKPGAAPWNSKVKGMLIEGIRRQPQGSLDFVPRGGAGGRLLLEGDEGGWPEAGWQDEDLQLVVSVAESFYSAEPVSQAATPDFSKMTAEELRAFVQENAPQLVPALAESAPNGNGSGVTATGATLTKDDVAAMIREAVEGGTSKIEVAEEQLTERFEERLAEREEQRSFADEAKALIEAAEGIPDLWKRDLIARYSMRPDGAPQALLVESRTDDDGQTLSKRQVLRENVERDLTHTRELIAEARGKPRVRGEGGAAKDAGGDDPQRRKDEVEESTAPGEWAESLAELGIFESPDDAYVALGEDRKSGKDGD